MSRVCVCLLYTVYLMRTTASYGWHAEPYATLSWHGNHGPKAALLLAAECVLLSRKGRCNLCVV